ncbi:MAG: spore coat protein [Bacillus sp. (in: Bacteria)]|nr:spore coat protein [Bacillus sp. (in: firmicutes)]
MNLANQMSDQAIATDLLLSAKAGVKNCAYALTEATSEDVRKTLNQQLQQAVIFQQKVADYMITQGYYQPHNLDQQIQVDQMTAQSVIQYSNQQGQQGQQQQFTNSSQPSYPNKHYFAQSDELAEQLADEVHNVPNDQYEQPATYQGYPGTTSTGMTNTQNTQQTSMNQGSTSTRQMTSTDMASYQEQTAVNLPAYQSSNEQEDEEQTQMSEETEQQLQLPAGQEKPPWKL